MIIGTTQEVARWYTLKDIDEQRRLVDEQKRFKAIPAGRRSGKTERFKRFLVKEAMANPGRNYFAGAPTHQQAKRIFWRDLKLLSFSSAHPKQPSETEMTIFLPNTSCITVVGLDKPERMEGQLWHGGGIDEFADTKSDAYKLNILPALDTVHPNDPEYRAWCWFFGVPEGLNHFYDLCEYAKGDSEDWGFYHWKSSEILPPEVIEAAKRRMSLKQFKQEYEASFETATGRIYEDYSDDNRTTEVIYPHEQLLWMHDFNFTPLSSAIGVVRDGVVYILDEIVLESAVARQTALEFVEKYKNHENKSVIIYGDPSGRAGEKHGHKSDYTEIESVLRSNGWSFQRQVRNAAPAIRDRQNAVRAKIKNAAGEVSLYINAERAPYSHKGLATVQFKKGSTFLEEETEFQHITTAIGYMIEFEYPIDDSAGFADLKGF